MHKYETTVTIAIVLIVGAFLLGKNVFPKKVIVNDYITECEKNHGEFNAYTFTNGNYRFYCEIPERKVYDYVIKGGK